jgi:hypothetical protein
MLKAHSAIVAAMALAAMLAGCLEVKQDYTLNPDCSGKVIVDLLAQEMPINAGQADAPDPEILAKQTVRRMLDGADGVDVWADVAYNRADDGRTHFKGTAYFKDLSKLKLSIAGLMGATLSKDDKGGLTLLIGGGPARQGDAVASPEAAKAAPPAPKLTQEETDQRIKAQRERFKQMRPMMEMFFAKARVEMSFRLPAAPADVSNLRKDPDGTLRFVLDGGKALQVIDQLMADEKYVRERAAAGPEAGKNTAWLNEALNEKLFGSRAPVRARASGDLKPLFDYAAEVKAAKDAYPKMLERLGLPSAPAAPPAAESGGKEPPPPSAAAGDPAK